MAVLALVIGEGLLSEMPLRRIANAGASGTLWGSGTMFPAERDGGGGWGFEQAVASGAPKGCDTVNEVSIGGESGCVKRIVHKLLKYAYVMFTNRRCGKNCL
jgi:hypothetical protein